MGGGLTSNIILQKMLNYFKIFGFEEAFLIDKQALEDKYLELQMQFHPDRQAGKSEKEKLLALKKSADINEAYKNLKNDVKRAEHLLALKEKFVAKEKDNDFKPNQDILKLKLELDEKLMEEGKTAISSKTKKLKEGATKNFNDYYIKGELENAAQEYFILNFLSKI